MTATQLPPQPGTAVRVTPALGAAWIGRVASGEMRPGGEWQITCLSREDGPGPTPGSVYAVLPRFVEMA